MTKLFMKMGMALATATRGLRRFVQEERGDFGIGQIVGIVAGIVIVGSIITAVTTNMPNWINQVWTWISNLIGP